MKTEVSMTLPLHRSGLALLTHPALPLGRDAHPLKRVRMMDCRFGKMALGDSLHAMPRNVTVLTSPAQGFPPASRHLEMEVEERLLVPRHSKVTVVTRKDRAQVFPLFSNRLRAAAPQLLLDLSMRFLIVRLFIVNIPFPCFTPQMWVNPRKSNVAGLDSPR